MNRLRMLLALCGALLIAAAPAKDIPWQAHDLLGVYSLEGDFPDMAAFREDMQYAFLVEDYPALEKIDTFAVDTGGQDMYFILPRHSDDRVSVYALDGKQPERAVEEGKLLYQGQGEALLIKIHSAAQTADSAIVVEDAQGRRLVYQPALRAEDGRLQVPESGVLDLHIPDYYEAQAQAEYEGIVVKVEEGTVRVHLDRQHNAFLPSIGITDIAMSSDTREVQGLSAPARGIHIGDIGQDYNPILCILTERGEVEILDLFNAIKTDDFLSSGVLFDHIVRFASLPSAEAMNLHAIDDAGIFHELPYSFIASWFSAPWQYRSADGQLYVVHFSSDWKINYQIKDKDGNIVASHHGRYQVMNTDNDGAGDYRYTLDDAEGSFRVRFAGESRDALLITPLQGPLRFASDGTTPTAFTFNGEPFTEEQNGK